MKPSFLEEYRALRDEAALVERSDRGRIAAAGADRLAYLHAMLTNDIVALRPGTGCYAAYLTPQGRMMADMLVLELGDLTLLDVEPCATSVVLEKLEQFIFSEDVRLSDLTSQLAEVRVCGPCAGDVLAAVVGEGGGVSAAALSQLAEYASLRGSFHGASAVVAADWQLGVPAFNVYLDRQQAGAFQDALRQAGAVDASEDGAEVLRIEAGRPRFGVDMDENTIPLEAGIEARAISFTKGCYPGQEVITRVLHRGHGRVAKRLVGVACDGDVVPARGDPFVVDGKEVGKVTSATMSPSLQSPIALGYVQRDFVDPGTAVSIVHGEARLAARVVGLPFIRSSR
jgi:folate-binding protein YgfZ